MSLPSDCAKPDRFYIGVMKGSLPSSGRYRIQVRFSSNTGVEYKANSCYLLSQKNNLNATSERSSTYDGTFMDFSGDWYYSAVIELGNVAFLEVGPVLKNPSNSVFPFGGYVSVNFTKTTSAPDYTTAGGPQTTDDIQSNIADNTAQQVEQGDTIIELIKNTIQTISSQLTAFWNQLAGEFTNLYNKMNAQHAEQLEADRSNTEDIIDAEQANTTNIINNNNQNTEKITNGYDSSALDESNNNLNNKLQEYESAESGITDTAGGWISDFTMPDFDNLINTGGILSACIWLGGFWQSLFTNMGSFNIPVTLSFVLIFVLMLVGYHRFRR